jgi:hypothetical protein
LAEPKSVALIADAVENSAAIAIDLRVAEVAADGDRDREVDDDHEDHAGIERAWQHGPGIAHVARGIGDEAEAFVADEENAGADHAADADRYRRRHADLAGAGGGTGGRGGRGAGHGDSRA